MIQQDINNKNNNSKIQNMSEREYLETLDTFTKDISDQDLDRLIINFQFIKAKRKRDFQSNVQYAFCDDCMITYPAAVIIECSKCDKILRRLPIRAEYNFLLDGEPNIQDGGNHFVTIQEE